MKQIIINTLIILIAVINSQAQKSSHAEKLEKYRSEKVAFLTSKLDLNSNEAQKFWPVYNQLEKEKWEIQKSRRAIEEKIRDAESSLSEAEIIKLTRNFAGSMQKEADIMIKYNEKFLKLLPPQKVLNLYQAENEFRVYMIKKFRDRRKNGD
ncbi:MAG: hypothetical protein PHN68_00490 [Prolixibacteraceae bacterium]|nr:hypothetical protein [Prolixibacteraceae bacterium]MDD4755040.1 hypothetical protein [Prolixibacteraceae bacterium]